MQQNEKQAVIQNLKDAGCSQEVMDCFLDCFEQGKTQEEISVLLKHRKMLLDALHLCQKQIDCLDYLVYQLEK